MLSITDTSRHVEQEHANTLYGLSPKDKLKATISFRALVESDGHNLKQTGCDWKCRCPFHPDRTPSFSIPEEDDRGRCYGCNWSGDIFAYVMERAGCDFRTAFIHLAAGGSLHGTRRKRSASAKLDPQDQKYHFTGRELQEIEQSTSRIIKENWLCEQIALHRKWKPSTIRALASSQHLGWGGDALNFIYKTGIKVRRWPGKEFKWWAGQPHIWRADLLDSASEVYFTEGEPDAITLIDIGVEKLPKIVVLAAPSANTFNRSWSELFTDKTVTLCFDADEPGRIGMQNVGNLIAPVAGEVRQWNAKEVSHD